MTPALAFIVVSYNTRDLLDACLASLYRHTLGLPFEVIVVDNASRDGSSAMVRRKYPEAVVVESGENIGFGRANNLGFSHSRADFIMLLNSDAELLEDTGAALVRFLERTPRAGLVGPEVISADGSRQSKTCGMLPTARVMTNQNLLLCRLFPRSRFFAGLYVETSEREETRLGWVSGVCVVVRRVVYAETGGFDPRIFMYAEDIDLCARAAARGWETWRIYAHAVKHLGGASSRAADEILRFRLLQQRNMLRMADRAMGPVGRGVTRATLAAGLLVRASLRGVAALRPGDEARRRAFRSDLLCLTDFFCLASGPREGSNADRT